jgi:hypothetical protein
VAGNVNIDLSDDRGWTGEGEEAEQTAINPDQAPAVAGPIRGNEVSLGLSPGQSRESRSESSSFHSEPAIPMPRSRNRIMDRLELQSPGNL